MSPAEPRAPFAARETPRVRVGEAPAAASRLPRARSGGVLAVLSGLALGGLLAGLSGCRTVRPEQRAILADPVMQFESEPGEEAARRHVLENREGATGSGAIKGGGCGCN